VVDPPSIKYIAQQKTVDVNKNNYFFDKLWGNWKYTKTKNRYNNQPESIAIVKSWLSWMIA